MPKVKMPGQGTRQTSLWIAPEDDEAISAIRREYGLSTIADAVRFAVRKIHDQIKAKRRRRPARRSGGEQGAETGGA